jgi:hypothetical protein
MIWLTYEFRLDELGSETGSGNGYFEGYGARDGDGRGNDLNGYMAGSFSTSGNGTGFGGRWALYTEANGSGVYI